MSVKINLVCRLHIIYLSLSFNTNLVCQFISLHANELSDQQTKYLSDPLTIYRLVAKHEFFNELELDLELELVFILCIHRLHYGAQNHQVQAGQASSFKFCKFASF